MNNPWTTLLLAACLALPSAASQARSCVVQKGVVCKPAAPEVPANGMATRSWLAAQRSGKQASHKSQALSGPVMEQVYDRYRKSFSHSIPAHFEREGFTNGGQ